jgi:biopolymer transport protein ExbD
MRVRNVARLGDKVELMMAPMIDIVFLLLVFFLLTFKIVEREGDFAIKMPQSPQAGSPVEMDIPPIKITLTADRDGELKAILLNEPDPTNPGGRLSIGRDFQKLRQHIRGIIRDDAGPTTAADYQVQFKADFDLRYKWVMKAITYASRYRDETTGELKTLVENIHFIPSPEVMQADI